MRPLSSLLTAVAPALLAAASLCAQTRPVPSQYPTIQGALLAAANGDTILVAPGVYNERLIWPSTDGIRLIGQSGAAVTTIDGGAGGTVVSFSTGPSRLTVLAGFTIMNGFLAGSHNEGAGIRIDNCSPTIRDNHITGNASDNTLWNYGGAIYVGGNFANPLIFHNEIDNNELRNGSWNYGAGIHVASPARAAIHSNNIHDNRNLTIGTAIGGRGHGAGIYCTGLCEIVSNFIVGNTNNTSSWNYGAGIAVASSGVAQVFNNTIVGNTVMGGNWRYGGGIYVDYSAVMTSRGNIIASNNGAGIYQATPATGFASTDIDCVWNNSPDYSGVVAGALSISQDPLFVSATDLHLAAASPCIDAITNGHLPGTAMDVDMDPRQVDGDLDGGITNGARLDIGADEFTSVHLDVLGVPQIGTMITWAATAAQPSIYLFAVDLSGSGSLVMEPFGTLLLTGTAVLVGVAATPNGFPFTIPNDPTLRAVTIFGQALVLPVGINAAQFTNLASITTW